MSNFYAGLEAQISFPKPEEIRASMTITMPIKQWEHIANQLSTEVYEEWPLRAAIMDLVRQAKRVLYAEPEKQG